MNEFCTRHPTSQIEAEVRPPRGLITRRASRYWIDRHAVPISLLLQVPMLLRSVGSGRFSLLIRPCYLYVMLLLEVNLKRQADLRPNEISVPDGPTLSRNHNPKEAVMGRCNRREFIEDMAGLAIASLVFPLKLGANPEYAVPHPLSPPDPVYQGRCPNCGMVRSMWARTWKSFEMQNGHFEACSFHCLVEQAEKSGHTPHAIQTALFLQPIVRWND